MKTVVPKSLLLGIFCWLATGIALGQTILFQQNFSSSTDYNTYVGTSGTDLFTQVTASSGTTVGINSGFLEFIKSSGGSGRLVRNAPALNPSNQTLYIEFDLAVPSSSAANLATAVLYIGSEDGLNTTGYNNNGTLPENNDVYCKLGINFIGTSGGFQLRNIRSSGSTNGSTSISDQSFHTITMIVNKLPYSIKYLVPGTVSTYTSLGSDNWQVYIDGTKQFASDLTATTAARDLNFLKFIYDGVAGTLQMDNFRIRTVEGILPVSLTRFNAQVNNDKDVEIEWITANERNSKSFAIERSSDLKTYTPIAHLDAVGNSNQSTAYRFTDENPLTGTSYYRLLQTDLDGSTVPYRPVAVMIESDISVFPNPASTSFPTWTVRHPQASDLTIRLTNNMGMDVPIRTQNLNAQEWLVSPHQTIPTGMYILQVGTSDKTHTKKVWIP